MAAARNETSTVESHSFPQGPFATEKGSSVAPKSEMPRDAELGTFNGGGNVQRFDEPTLSPEDQVISSGTLPLRAEERAIAQPGPDDLELASPTLSGPVYSVFGRRQRRYIVFMIACAGFFSPLSANIYFPALNSISHDLNVSSDMINLSLTTYMIFQGLAPTIFGDLADMTGRRPTYMIGFCIYIGANIGLAMQNNYTALLILRCLQSTGSSGTVALGSGVVADIASSGERGTFMGKIDACSPLNSFLTECRHCSIRTDGCSGDSTRCRRDFGRISRMAVAFLVLDHPSSYFFDTSSPHFP